MAAGVAAVEIQGVERLSTATAEVGAGGDSAPSLLLLDNARTPRRVEGIVGGRRLWRRGGGGAVVVRGRVGDVEVVRLAIRRIRLGRPRSRQRTLAQAVRPRLDVGAISCGSSTNSRSNKSLSNDAVQFKIQLIFLATNLVLRPKAWAEKSPNRGCRCSVL